MLVAGGCFRGAKGNNHLDALCPALYYPAASRRGTDPAAKILANFADFLDCDEQRGRK
jgi:hypothetical protein